MIFSKFLSVQKEFLEDVVLEENYGLPCFLFGHSTGGAIVLKVKQNYLISVFDLSS
jgi:alpha-beta hydrolase superfamily lysophospholipase